MNDSEIRKMVDFVKQYDIVNNPAPEAIFDPLSQGFNIHAIETNHPASYESVKQFMDKGAWSKKCAFVGTAWFDRESESIHLSTDAYILHDHKKIKYKEIRNRPQEVVWAKEKIKWVFEKIQIECPPIFLEVHE